MPLDFHGADDLQKQLQELALMLENSSETDSALEQGAKPIEEQMKANASHDPQVISGKLRNSIRTGKVKKNRYGGKSISVGVHAKDNGAYYANPVEYGHGGPAPAPAHPFVRPAFDSRQEEAYSIIKAALKQTLSK